MSQKNYQHSLTVTSTAKSAYRAVTEGYNNWWTATDDAFNAVGDRIKFMFPPNVSYWTFEAKVLKPNERVELECVEALHKIVDNPGASETEWLGSRLVFDVEQSGKQTTIHLTHDGLVPELDCYEVCEAGWNMFFVNSLKSYLETGVGQPHRAG